VAAYFLFTFGKIEFIMNRLFILVAFISMLSCGTQRSLQKSFLGKPQSVLSGKFGNPKTVFDSEDGKIYVYEIVKELKSATINQGKLTLDPMVSPGVQKTERYYFTVKDDKIVAVKVDDEYQR
jgi:hypothetical protein